MTAPASWLRGLPLAVVDTETTGLDPASCHVVEIAVVHLDLGGAPSLAWSSRIRPPIPIPPEATKVHGIRDEDVADAPRFADVLADLGGAMADRVLVAFNAPFDYGQLGAELLRLDADPGLLRWPWLDPLVWSRAVDRFAKGGHNLGAVCQRRGISYPAHGAAADATATALLVRPLLAELYRLTQRQVAWDRQAMRCTDVPPGTWRSPGAFLGWQQTAAMAQERDYAEWSARQGRPAPTAPWHALAGLQPPAVAAPPPRSTDRCASCGAPILWTVTAAGKAMPLDPEAIAAVPLDLAEDLAGQVLTLVDAGGQTFRGVVVDPDIRPDLPRLEGRIAHWATCPHAAEHRRSA